jgi:hypothetical protein
MWWQDGRPRQGQWGQVQTRATRRAIWQFGCNPGKLDSCKAHCSGYANRFANCSATRCCILDFIEPKSQDFSYFDWDQD